MNKTEKEIKRGEDARRLLDSEIYKEAVEHIDAELWRLFKETPPQDLETLQFVKSMQYFHEKYRSFLNRAVSDGKIAEINEKAKRSGFLNRIMG